MNRSTGDSIHYDWLGSDKLKATDKVILEAKITSLRSKDAGKTTE